MRRRLGHCWSSMTTRDRVKKGRKGRRRRLKTQQGRGTLAKEKPPILGMIQRGGEVVLQMLSNVKQGTITPLIQNTIALGTLIYTDEYRIYARLVEWGYQYKSVCHAKGEYAQDEDGDGFHEVHVNTSGRFLVSPTLVVETSSGNFSSKAAAVSWLF